MQVYIMLVYHPTLKGNSAWIGPSVVAFCSRFMKTCSSRNKRAKQANLGAATPSTMAVQDRCPVLRAPALALGPPTRTFSTVRSFTVSYPSPRCPGPNPFAAPPQPQGDQENTQVDRENTQ
jgi:hypothetical protein